MSSKTISATSTDIQGESVLENVANASNPRNVKRMSTRIGEKNAQFLDNYSAKEGISKSKVIEDSLEILMSLSSSKDFQYLVKELGKEPIDILMQSIALRKRIHEINKGSSVCIISDAEGNNIESWFLS